MCFVSLKSVYIEQELPILIRNRFFSNFAQINSDLKDYGIHVHIWHKLLTSIFQQVSHTVIQPGNTEKRR